MRSSIHRRERKFIRLRDYDYTRAGAYFVTICTKNRECLLGEIAEGNTQLTPYGNIVWETWNGLSKHYPHVTLDAFIIMPNHIHGIIVLDDTNPVGAGFKPAPTKPAVVKPADSNQSSSKKRHGLSEIIRAFKTFSARKINELRQTPGVPLWQRNYYEHIIRDSESLDQIRQYILHNPLNWSEDAENPAVIAQAKTLHNPTNS